MHCPCVNNVSNEIDGNQNGMRPSIIPGYGLQLTLLSREDSNRWSTYRAKSTRVCYQTNVQLAELAVRWSVLRETISPVEIYISDGRTT